MTERGRQRVRLSGEPPSPLDPASAFRFLPSRLPLDPARPPSAPRLEEVEPGHFVSEFEAIQDQADCAAEIDSGAGILG